MALNSAVPVADAPNHLLAKRMGLIAGVSHNVVIGTIMGSFSVLLASVEGRLGVKLEQASAGILLMIVGSSALAPIVGVLVARYSLRLLLMLGGVLTVLGYLILGLTQSYPLYLAVYGLCFGPALSLAGSIGPATLVTRWFNSNRGLALGLVHLPIMIAVLPVALNAFLADYGAQAAYLTLAGVAAILMLPLTALTVDHPPGYVAPVSTGEKRTADGSLSTGQLLASPKFWALSLANCASMTSSVMLGSLLIPMGQSWDFSRGQSALLASIMSLVGIAGSVLFGWVADKLGGGRTLALVAFDCAILWALLLTEPPFAAVAVIVGLIGMHGAGAIPALGRGVSDTFGQPSYSRGFGLNTVISLPFIACAMLGGSRIARETGSFAIPVTAMAIVFAIAVLCGLYAASGVKAPTRQADPQPA
ncbi:putative MFS family arabinose efflux permease [Novosphingobium chloroacetimidivorans]|uniref:Putative MFS family arabinose efflux permease n=1 Tax=Novosphingobium chloroacetimidivorans TaxID=1428314 RepID=A0A7W7NVG3_9SPHN|nr:MFS transporter [Novosphingobium chloroacetimidivorans]MBB4858216.1 putative MFS family arabinose efflux permease [Novosphingobium chloroacetimidivorans]